MDVVPLVDEGLGNSAYVGVARLLGGLTVDEVAAAMEDGAEVVDVRQIDAFAAGQVEA
ncbi:MAG: hypothetical protein WD378_09255 [Egicoccus sp.]